MSFYKGESPDPEVWDREPPLTCRECGTEDNVSEVPIQNFTGIDVFPLCGSCCADQVTACPDCKELIWQDEGIRVFTSSNLYCTACAKQHGVVVQGLEQAARIDVDRDEFNITRR